MEVGSLAQLQRAPMYKITITSKGERYHLDVKHASVLLIWGWGDFVEYPHSTKSGWMHECVWGESITGCWYISVSGFALKGGGGEHCVTGWGFYTYKIERTTFYHQ